MIGGEVDVDVGCPLVVLVEKALEQQVMGHRVDAGDVEQVGDDRVRGAAAPLPGNVMLVRVSHDVPRDQEELGKSCLLDDVQLALQARRHQPRHRVVLALHRFLAERVEHRERRLALGHRESRKANVAEIQRHRALRRDARCRVEGVGMVTQTFAHDRLRLQAMLVVGEQQAVRGGLVERGAMPDGGEHVEQRLVVRCGVVRGGAGDHGQSRRSSERGAFGVDPSVGGMQVVGEQDRGAVAAEAFAQPLCMTQRGAAVAAHQRVDQRAVRSADQRDAAAELGGLDAGRLTLGEERGRGQPRPAGGMRSARGAQRRGALGWRQLVAGSPPG